MLSKFYKISALSILLLSLISSVVSAQADGSKNPYSVEAVSLKGHTNTDVYLTFSTTDPSE